MGLTWSQKFVQPEPTQGSTFPISFPDGKRCYWGNGASVHGTRQEASTVFMRLPYLGFEGNYPTANTNVEEFTESLTLPEYSRVMADEILPTDFRINRNAEYNKIWVHQVWVIVVNNESILVSRSANDGNEQARPLLAPGQPFESIYHSLFQMLSRFLKLPDRKLLELFRRIVLRYERSSLLTEDQSFTDSETIRRDLAHMLMVKSMLDDQIGVLESLGEIFEHATGYSYEADINRTDVDRVYIPHLTDESTIARDVQRLRNLITERKQHREKFASLIAAIRKMFDTVQAGDTKTATQTALNQQLKYAEALNDEVAYQGKTISMFTAINVLFLPLGFFAQYLGLGFNQINTLVNFWRITGPLTAIIIIPTVYIVLISKYKTRQFAKFFWLCCKGRVRGFLNAPDSQTQEKYLKGLPKYRIALEERATSSKPKHSTHYTGSRSALRKGQFKASFSFQGGFLQKNEFSIRLRCWRRPLWRN
ncbi:hypothetical protein FN846DRAFT_324757 [Sphaerosporella brunnea]|uniref:Uncharacterized protein n=1 Tax=Sphaerosporella brunnea TaxID=1250544 RepID=A0A5J5F6R8_9PEZI|nr:hypothetical protein FN846DRAFT_324757 [Sphaerosporella brunnea]